jgi:hypothetical protein
MHNIDMLDELGFHPFEFLTRNFQLGTRHWALPPSFTDNELSALQTVSNHRQFIHQKIIQNPLPTATNCRPINYKRRFFKVGRRCPQRAAAGTSAPQQNQVILNTEIAPPTFVPSQLSTNHPSPRPLTFHLPHVTFQLRACLKKGLAMTARDKRVEARRGEGAY